MLRVNKVHRVSTVTTTVEILQGPAWTLIRGPRWRVEKKKSTWLVLYLSFTKDSKKLDLLQILVLVLPLNFLNYILPVLLLSNLMSYDTVRRCMKLAK